MQACCCKHSIHACSLLCSCIRQFGATTQHIWLWLDVLSDLLFLQDLCVLLLSAYYTDRTANALVASQTASVEAGQHEQASAGQHNTFDRKSSKLSLAPVAESAGVASKSFARSMSRTKSKRDMSYMPNVIGELPPPWTIGRAGSVS